MEELQAAMTAHLDQVSDLVKALSSELRRGMGPAADNLRAFIRAVDWTVFSPDPLIGDRIRISKTLLFFPSLTSRADKECATVSGAMAHVLDGIPCGSAAHCCRVQEECQFPAILVISCL